MIRGTTPHGADSEEQASRWVRGMFGHIAPRYDLLNHLLSLNLDRWWRARTVRRLAPLLRPEARVLDVCCGTGDLALALARAGAQVWASDFSHSMLLHASRKGAARVFEADALSLPVRDGAFDVITVAFGFRNLANYRAGLRELARVLKPGGTLAILEFSQPPNALFRALYGVYSRHVLPAIGGLVSGSRDAYAYLPESVGKFPGAEELRDQMRMNGFQRASFERMTFGTVALHLGQTPRPD